MRAGRGPHKARGGRRVLHRRSSPQAGQPNYWELSFGEQARTRVASVIPQPASRVYDEGQGRLFVVQVRTRQEIGPRPQAHRLVCFMARRKSGRGGAAVLCSHQELMRAVWADEPVHTREELNKLFWGLRRRLQPSGAKGRVESARGAPLPGFEDASGSLILGHPAVVSVADRARPLDSPPVCMLERQHSSITRPTARRGRARQILVY
jgi:hypothetical protein